MATESPLALALAQTIRDQIATGIMPEGRPLPSERVLSEKFAVSRAIIRQVVAILAAQGLLSVQPNCRPVVTPRGSSDTTSSTKVGHVSVWLWPVVDDYAVSSIFRGIQKGLYGTSFRILAATAAHTDWEQVLIDEQSFLRDCCSDSSCVGAIMWLLGGARSLPLLKESRMRNLPFVFVDRKPPIGFEADFVGTDNHRSAQHIIEHLISLGHRRIACLTNSDDVSSVWERLAGYRRALADARLPYDERLVTQFEICPGETDSAAMDRMVEHLLALPDPPTAVFAINDTTALLLIERLESQGYSVPGQISVAGFDGLLRWVPGGGRLTTADQDYSRIGELAAELLKERIGMPVPSTYRHVLLDAPMRVHGSTGPVGGDNDQGLTANKQVEIP